MSKLSRSVMFSAIALAMAGSAGAGNPDPNRVLVTFAPGSKAQVENAIRGGRGQVHMELAGLNTIAVTVPAQALNGLRNNPNILDIEEDSPRYLLALDTPSTGNPYALGQAVPYGIPQVQADQMPNGDAFTGNRKVCIIDSGYDRNHEDLSSGTNITGEYDSGTGWWYTDENSHGTHVAGTIAALNNAGKGVVGVNPNNNLKLHIVKVFNAAGWAYSSSLITAVTKCRNAGSNVISMSLGGGRSSKTEQKAFDQAAAAGVLSIAAAGNDGNTVKSYPASYASVMSVAAVDENKAWATFSQYNNAVDISGPGVGVLSTVPMNTGSKSVLSVGSTTYAPGDMDGSPKITRTGALFDFGLGNATNSGASGKVCLIARGTVDFATKVTNCQNSGGVGAVIYNNAPGGFGGTLGTTVTSIPSVTASDSEGAAMLNQLGQSATVGVAPSSYAYFDGTSMATPHVSAVAALVWSYYPNCTGNQMKASLEKSALDIGTAGYDNKTGWGLVQARAAYNRIAANGCGN